MLSEALRAPFRSDDTWQTLAVGAALSLVVGSVFAFVSVSVLFLSVSALIPGLVLGLLALAPELILRGYYVRVARAGIRGDAAVPSLVHWGRLFRDGLGLLVVDVVYFLPTLLVFVCGIAVTVVVNSRKSVYGDFVAADTLVRLIVLLTLLLTAVSVLVYCYLRPAAVTVFAAERRLRSAFALRRVGRVAIDGDYATGWLLAVVVTVSAVFLSGLLSLVLVGFAVWFFSRTVAYSLYGRSAASILTPVTARSETEAHRSPPATFDDRRLEVSAAVQTGRTVRFGSEKPERTDGAGEIGATHADAEGDTDGTGDSDTGSRKP